MQITISSTTDTPANVQAALGNKAEPKADAGKESAAKGPDSSAPANKSEQNEAAASDTGAKEVDESESDTDAEGAESGDESEEAKEAKGKDDKPKKQAGGWQRRIDKKTREAADAARERDYWKAQALKSAAAGDKPAQSQEAATKPTGEPDPGKYDSHAEYVKALANWTADQKLEAYKAEQQKKARESEQNAAIQSYGERVKSFAEKTTDYHDVIAGAEDVPMSQAMQSLIIESDHGPAIAYELAKNPEVAERIAQLPPLKAALEMGKLEARIAQTASASSGTKQEIKKTTKAPKPLEPVGSKGAAVDKDIYDAANMSQREYERARAKQRAESNAS